MAELDHVLHPSELIEGSLAGLVEPHRVRDGEILRTIHGELERIKN